MHPKRKEQVTIRQIFGFAVNLALTAAVIYAAVFLLGKGSIHYREESQWALGILIGLPVVLRPRRRATVPELLVHDALVLLGASSLALLLTEYVVKGGIVIGNVQIWQGYVYHAAVFGIVYLLVVNIRLTACIGMGLTLVYALVDHYVMVFRGTPVLLGDLLSIGTAKNVAAGYSAPVELSVLQTVAIAAVFCLAVWRMRRPAAAPRRWQFAACSLLLACWMGGLRLAGNSFGFWQGNLEYSELYYFCRTAAATVVNAPEGYTDDTVTPLTAEYTGRTGEMQPNIIMIMNESFADLGTLGEFETNEDYMPYVRSLLDGADNTVSGSLMVSTLGGGTATTEFEVLSGSSMVFLPVGGAPYQMFVRMQTPGLVSGLRAQGYQTTAMHPYRASSWNRQEVYGHFGFETQLYEPDFAADAGRLRGFISDSADYQKIIELYEQKAPGVPLFLFNVTMQNHGGYGTTDDPNFETRIRLTGEYAGQYPQVDQYLSLIRYSDDAVRELIEYFSQVDEPTAIVFFGDHQPNVTSAFYDELLDGSGKGIRDKMFTPFFIWANYDIAEQQDVQISANYLSAYTLDVLGCPLSGYDSLRLQTYAVIPQMSLYGCQTADGEWMDTGTARDNAALTDYQYAQYAQLFDPQNRVDAWYEPTAVK